MIANLHIPGLRLVSEANEAGSSHWRVRDSRRKKQKKAVDDKWRFTIEQFRGQLPLLVTITRHHPPRNRIKDKDNLSSSRKYVQDVVAEILGVNDSSTDITFDIIQEPGDWGVTIRIEPRTHLCKCVDTTCKRVLQ